MKGAVDVHAHWYPKAFPIAYERPVDVVTQNPHLSAEAKQSIISGNARRLLKL